MDATFDDSRWPIVVVTLPPRQMDERAFDEYCTAVEKYYERQQSFGYVFDLRKSPPLTAQQRRTIAERIDRGRLEHANVHVVVAVVLGSAVHRGVVKAITWLTHQPVPTEVFGSIDAAISWVRRALATSAGTGQPSVF